MYVFAISKEYNDQSIELDVTGVEQFAVLTCIPPHWLTPVEPTVEKVQLTSWDTVNGIRRVPYQVEQQRTVTQTSGVPFWEMWTNPTAKTQPSSSTAETNQPGQPTGLIYSDDFSSPDSGWPKMVGEYCQSYYENGEYQIAVSQPDWMATRYNQNSGTLDDCVIEEDIRPVSGDENSEYGLIFRCQDDDNFYYSLVSADGYYLMGKRIDGKWHPLRRWTICEYVNKGFSSNHLKVVCQGSQIDFYVNGNLLGTAVDDTFASGYVGGMVYVPKSGCGSRVAFDNLKVYNVN